MGSEQYCLRWNNHQSNLLGVFSQLLQDESLVDVTLACSEGASIRAHKVVLSACSSYFQSLFLDHPAKHPIVILKDVRFSELRTLIEFMYKGEVNVEYCQLSALLKTAESLKVKGLAEMTNQNTALKEPERESERLRLHTPNAATTTSSSSVKSELEFQNKQRLENENCSPSPTRLPSSPGGSLSALYQRKLTSGGNTSTTSTATSGSSSHHIDSLIKEEPSSNDHHLHSHHRPNSRMDDDDDNDDDMRSKSNEVGINMTMSSNASINSTSAPSELGNPSLRYSTSILGNAGSGNRNSPSTDSLPGPSGIGPVQNAPLSLKKEADWDRSDDKDNSDYRHSHEMESTESHGGGSGNLNLSSSSNDHNSSVNNNGGNSSGGLGGPIYPCMYCGATFPHQSKLTRHILSHSLETLKYRETAHLLHPQLAQLLPPHDLPPPSHYPSRPGPPLDSLEPPENSPMDLDFAAAAAIASGMQAANNNPNNEQNSGGNGPGASNAGGGVVLCKFCGKSFPDVSSLITHLPVHTGDRPFKCEFCGKAFKLRHHMKDHCRVHTGERPFRCNICGKTFSRSTILKAHEKTHYPKYVRKFLSPSPVDNKDDAQQ